MAHGKSLELQQIKKPEPEGLCARCRVPWSTHLKKDGNIRKKFDDGTHHNTISLGLGRMGYVRGTPIDKGPQPGPQKSLGPPRNKRRKPTVHPMKIERAKRAYDEIMEANRPDGQS